MIQSFGEKLKGPGAFVLVAIFALPLGFLGVESLFLGANRVNNVATVEGEGITEIELLRAISSERARLQRFLPEGSNPDLISDDTLRPRALRNLVQQKVLLSHARNNNMGISEERILQEIRDIPSFQSGGSFDPTLFQNTLQQLAYTYAQFIESYGDDVLYTDLTSALGTSAFSTDTLLAQQISVAQETRSYDQVRLPVSSVLNDVTIEEQQIQDYYDQHPENFQLPERVKVDYVELNVETFAERVEVTEEDIAARFEARQAAEPDRLEVAHILLEALSDDKEQEQKVAEIQEKLASGSDFDTLAKEYSDDIGTSENGGYLGFTTGATFPAAFEEAAAALQVGEVSDPVETESGVHLIKLLSIDKSSLNLESERQSIEQELALEGALDLYREELQRLNEAYDTLDEVIEVIGAENLSAIKTSGIFDRDTGDDIASNPQVRGVAFSQTVKDEGYVSEVVELSDTRALVMSLNDQYPPGTAELDQVRSQIEQTLRTEKGSEILITKAEEIAQQLRAGDTVEALSEESEYTWQADNELVLGGGGEIGDAVFKADISSGLPLVGSLTTASGDQVVYRINSVKEGDTSTYEASQLRQLKERLSQSYASAEFEAYNAMLTEQSDIDIKIGVELDL